ncbi:MBL fold metallo-hydrolase [Candidatus Latescibacterota bacterium]
MTRRRWLRYAGAAGAAAGVVGGVGLADAWSAFGARARGSRRERILSSPNFRDGRFQDPLPRQEDMWLALRRWLQGGQHRVPTEAVPVTPVESDRFTRKPETGLRLTWLGHSSMLVEIGGGRFLTDPMWSRRAAPSRFWGVRRFYDPPMPLAQLPPLDAVVLSHDHYDHLDEATIRQLSRTSVPFIAPLGVGAHLEHWGVPGDRIVELDWWESTSVADTELTCTPARHFSGRTPLDRDATLWCGWVLGGRDHRVYFSGDTAMFPGIGDIGERLGPFDATMVEIGAYHAAWADVHLGPEQAALAHRVVGGGLMLPTHWGTFNLSLHGWTEPAERLMAAARREGVAVAIPRPGQSIEPASPPELERWWPPLPWETAEQAPIVSSGLAAAPADRPATL